MITPQQLRRKAQNKYADLQLAWLVGNESFFPLRIPANTELPKDIAESIRVVDQLRNASKEVLDYGYSIEWSDSIRSRTHGRNRRPAQLFFETRDDMLRLIRKVDDFRAFTAAVTQLRAAFGHEPAHAARLEEWFGLNIRLLTEAAQDIDGVIHVVQYFVDHPHPGVFARELPLPIDTKFVERRKPILRQLFDLLLPRHAIRSEESRFEVRYGLRYAEPVILTRFLDAGLREELGIPFAELGLSLGTLAGLAVSDARVFIVENKVSLLTLLTLPQFKRGIALGALGNAAATVLQDVKWLANVPLYYWGDLDVDGLKILADFRAVFPHVRSLLMDDETLHHWSSISGTGNGRIIKEPSRLLPHELAAFRHCRDNNVRLEQEHIPMASVMEAMSRL